MKKRTIIALIVAAALILSGGMILLLGLSYAGSGIQESTQTQQDILISESFHSIEIDTKDCDVKFVPYNGEANAMVTVIEQENVSHNIMVEDEILKIEMIDNRNWTEYVGIFQVLSQSESMEMTVYLPIAAYETIQVTTDTGDIRIPGVLTARQVQLRSDTGDVWVEGGPVQTLDCMVFTGDITVLGGDGIHMKLCIGTGDLDISGVVAEELHLESDTGETSVKDTTVQIFSFNGSTGGVELDGIRARDYLQVFTSTGDIDIENSDAPTVNIESSTGDIEVPAAWKFQRIETNTGDIKFK